MATEKPTLPAPEEQVSPAAEDAQANPAVTARVPEPEMPAAGPAAEASAAAEEPVAEVADAPVVTALGAGWPCGPWHLDLCVLPWALHPVLRSDVLPEGAAIQTEQLRNPAASNHTLRGSFLLLPLSRK